MLAHNSDKKEFFKNYVILLEFLPEIHHAARLLLIIRRNAKFLFDRTISAECDKNQLPVSFTLS